MDRNQPFNNLPPLPPAAELETPSVLKKAIAANRKLAELKGLVHSIPNQAILINDIILQEARLSSEIENIVTTNDELYKAAADEKLATDPQSKEVLCYRQALWHGYQQLKNRPLSTNLFIELVAIIKNKDIGIRRVPGTRIGNSREKWFYTPPEGESIIRDKLANLEQYLHADDGVDPLIKLAVIHYQFEAIHPFTDGNGSHRSYCQYIISGGKRFTGNPYLVSQQLYFTNPSRLLYRTASCHRTRRLDWMGIIYIRRHRNHRRDHTRTGQTDS